MTQVEKLEDVYKKIEKLYDSKLPLVERRSYIIGNIFLRWWYRVELVTIEHKLDMIELEQSKLNDIRYSIKYQDIIEHADTITEHIEHYKHQLGEDPV